ncbi:MAG TPA: hypothetical protein DCQ64_26890 [Candidatus Rokubacteria bacterium]|nr:hypothetical protein [Candidatus Rokubacteria bacterium]
MTFARAPDLAIALRDQRGSLDKTKFRVGLEAMTDTILARMRRGMCVSDVLAVCGEVIARGGQVTLQMMSPLPGEIGDEQRARTSDAVADLQRRGLIVSDNGPTFWRRREDASEFGRPLATLGGWTAV